MQFHGVRHDPPVPALSEIVADRIADLSVLQLRACVPKSDGRTAGCSAVAHKVLEGGATAGLLGGGAQTELQRVHDGRLAAAVFARHQVHVGPAVQDTGSNGGDCSAQCASDLGTSLRR